jgi:ArsR family transcriptional regulator, arsenate/arsenite/antimonite-responsive transcriptional repressor
MTYVCNIFHLGSMTYTKSVVFDNHLQEISRFAKVLSHPARLAILQHLTQCCGCKSGDIADVLPLSRSTVSQHLQELKNLGILKSNIDGVKVCYEIDLEVLLDYKRALDDFFAEGIHALTCGCKLLGNHVITEEVVLHGSEKS